MKKHDTIARYKLPAEIRYCKNCTISNQRPRITFDEDGVCSACNYAEYKRTKVDWAERDRELMDLCNRFRRRDGSYDVVVPVSGGKDGSFVAHQLKYKYNMNPLTVKWAPNIYTEIGETNLRNFLAAGFDHILGRPNPQVNRKLVRLGFEHLGDPFQAFIYGQTNFPLRTAVHHGIQLIMYGENGEVEYGGNMKYAYQPTREIVDHDVFYFSGLNPDTWKAYGLTERDLHLYEAPPYARVMENKTEIHFLGYYKCWDPQENYYYAREHTGFLPNPEHSEGTYSKYASLDDRLDGFHYWMGFIKFGIGRATSDSAHEIRDQKITREEGIALIKRYDGEFPKKHFKEFLDYCQMSEDQFWEIVESWRSEHVWKKVGNDWELKSPIWK
ncbi:N-acetyl sugar amidotransferase [Dongia rigui]|uniref:N-acetyl sugar amidotransferase n=1 Tax=Dongia rigui TaxID=940149 RepID=A0ABU5E374_9PROT|nr:N-acetyl sugar amidotransferase [Dongia rigui]MDY0873649.1 N-acetyl sugar amidotransferase [Dongia rigui]